MSIKAKIASDAELTRTKLLNSSLDDDMKDRCNILILHAIEATNGISQEEKIQNMTESLASLIDIIITNMCRTNARLDEMQAKAEEHHPVDKLEEIKKFEQNLTEAEKYRKINGMPANIILTDDNINAIVQGITNTTKNIEEQNSLTYRDKIINLFKSPWPWIFGMFLVFSPHFNDLLHAITSYFNK